MGVVGGAGSGKYQDRSLHLKSTTNTNSDANINTSSCANTNADTNAARHQIWQKPCVFPFLQQIQQVLFDLCGNLGELHLCFNVVS